MEQRVTDAMKKVLANTYALFLKTQNYHWNIKGPDFNDLHEMFEKQYNDLFIQIDDTAERIRALGEISPGTFEQFATLTTITPADASKDANSMVADLATSHQEMITSLQQTHTIAQECNDPATAYYVSKRMYDHQKTLWMLQAKLA